ncbi:hypothetical protein [Fictibacillus sp. BK138]|uniref:hypothetical protein n=1 Tax=Fictibacillus sp. BK138 TaxID=2512121 RepID=UPI0013EEB31B|nr:hypothetical protein [Fictibacillus sp. BK138]
MTQSGRRLTACPVESEHPGAEINYFQNNMIAKIAFYFCTSGLSEEDSSYT